MEQRELWNAYNKQALDKMKAGGVQFHDIDKAFSLTRPRRCATSMARSIRI